MTDWQKQYEIGETPWVKGRPHPHLITPPRLEIQGRWLVPGCGLGHDAAALMDSGADEVVGLDIAPLAVEQARSLWQDNPLITIQSGDLFNLKHGPLSGTFDGVWEHTCFCAIPPDRRNDYVRSVAAALKPFGCLLTCFYLNPWDPGEDQTQGPPFGSTLEELDTLFGLDFILEKEFPPTATFEGREGRELIRCWRKKA